LVNNIEGVSWKMILEEDVKGEKSAYIDGTPIMPTQRTQALYNPVFHYNDTRRRYLPSCQDYHQFLFVSIQNEEELTGRMLEVTTRLDPYENIHLHIAHVNPCI
jgi:hypothetical protein